MRLRVYLSMVVTAVLIPVIIFSALALKMLLDDERDTALSRVTESTRVTALIVDRELGRAEASLEALATSRDLANGNLEAFYRQAAAATGRSDAWTVLLDMQGRQLINTSVPFGAPLPGTANQQGLREILDAHQRIVSDMLYGPVVRDHVIAVAIPVLLQTGKRYVIAQVFRAEHFSSAFRRPNIPPTWMSAIVDRKGKTIARSHSPEEYVGKPTIPDLARASRLEAEGAVRTRSLDGIPVYAVYTHSELSNWTVAIGVPIDEVESAARRAVMIAALGLLAAFACAVGLAIFFSRRLVHAIDGATHSAEALGHGEVIAATISDVAEINQLSAALVKAGALLSRAQAEQARLFAIEQSARERAELESKSKDQFLALLSHELRNPLAAIVGAVDVIHVLGPYAESSLRAQQVIARQSQHLSRIVDDILEVSRMTTGRISLTKQEGDLAAAVQSALDALHAAKRTEGYLIHVDARSVKLDADWTRIDQIINNLLINAIKYTLPGGAINVRVYVAENNAVLEVQDTGIGIAPDLLPRVFDPFVQGEVSIDRSQGGLGIGLTLVRELVKLHGGVVEASSDGVGRGSLFIVRFPLYN